MRQFAMVEPHRLNCMLAATLLSVSCAFAECPKTAPVNNACKTEIMRCGGISQPNDGCEKRSADSVQNGPFDCGTTSGDKECLDGQANQTMHCFIRYGCKLVPGRGCLADGLVTEVQDRVIKVERACRSSVGS